MDLTAEGANRARGTSTTRGPVRQAEFLRNTTSNKCFLSSFRVCQTNQPALEGIIFRKCIYPILRTMERNRVAWPNLRDANVRFLWNIDPITKPIFFEMFLLCLLAQTFYFQLWCEITFHFGLVWNFGLADSSWRPAPPSALCVHENATMHFRGGVDFCDCKQMFAMISIVKLRRATLSEKKWQLSQ